MENAGGTSVRISTPEAVSFTYDAAGVGSRFIAAAIDSLLISAIMYGVTIVFFIIFALLSAFQGGESFIDHLFDTAKYLLIALAFFLTFCIIWGYYMMFEHFRGGVSPGKKVAGIRVVKADGSPLAFSDIFIRNIIRIADFLPSFYIAGAVTIAVSQKKQRLGDLAAGTLVVHNREATFAGRRTQWGAELFSGFCRIPLEPREYETVTGFLSRRFELHPQRRAQLAARMAAALSRKYDQPLERFPDNESFLFWLFAPDAAQPAPPAMQPEPPAGDTSYPAQEGTDE